MKTKIEPGPRAALRKCLGWCGQMFFSMDEGDRYCRKCRAKKEEAERTMSRCEHRLGEHMELDDHRVNHFAFDY